MLSGGVFTWVLLACMVIGIIFAVERLRAITRAQIDAGKFLNDLLGEIDGNGVVSAIETCSKTPGPLANTIHAGLLRTGRGIDQVEKAMATAGAIEMGFLEKNLIWLVSVVSIAPMIGFLGTVVGIIEVFDSVARTNAITLSLIAGGIARALKTTIFGLVIAIPIQLVHSYCVSRIDRIVADMEESALKFLDALEMRGKI